jgi:hypothetical protein
MMRAEVWLMRTAARKSRDTGERKGFRRVRGRGGHAESA